MCKHDYNSSKLGRGNCAGEDDLPSPGYMSSAPKGLGHHTAGQKSRVFQGGFYQDLHKMLDVSSGGEVSSLSLVLATSLGMWGVLCAFQRHLPIRRHCLSDL